MLNPPGLNLWCMCWFKAVWEPCPSGSPSVGLLSSPPKLALAVWKV